MFTVCSTGFHNSRGSNFTLIRIHVQKSNPRWRLRDFVISPPIAKDTILEKRDFTSYRQGKRSKKRDY